jgi:Domain of Unknown Function (DUF1259)
MNYDNLLVVSTRSRRFSLRSRSLVMLPIIWFAATCAPAQKPAHPEKQTQPGASQWKQVEDAMGRSGTVQTDGAIKFGMPRKDLTVVVGGITVKPGLALGSWAAFKKDRNQALLMGDLVLSGDEVAPVMAKLQDGGVEVTALHNHLLDESPRVMYMHIGGHGDAVKLATTLHDALVLTKTPGPSPASTAPAEKISMDVGQIEHILGHSGKTNGGIFQVAVPRSEKILMHGVETPPSMGVATSLNFQPTENGRAAVAGDFVLLAGEVNPVIQALRENGIAVTALHSHMLEEQPRLFFMHFWAEDDAVKLAHGLRAALDHTKSAR